MPRKPSQPDHSRRALELKLADQAKQAEQVVPQPGSDAGIAVLRRHQVLQRLGISNSTLYDWVKRGILPEPISFGPRTQVRLWLERDIDQVLIRLAQERDVRGAP
jgi:prophage regulatory protein